MKLLDISGMGRRIDEQEYEWSFRIITDESMSHNFITELGAACDEAIQEVFRKCKYEVEI